MGTALVTLPDGKRAKITFDSQEQLDATVHDLVSSSKEEKQEAMIHGDHKTSDAIADTGLSLASGAVAGLAGGANYLGTLIATQDPAAAKSVQEETQNRLTHQPTTEGGKKITETLAKPFQWLAGKADQAGEWVSQKTGSPALGAAANVALQSAPGAVLPAARALMRGGSAAAEGMSAEMNARPRQEPFIGENPPSAAQTPPIAQQPPSELTASAIPRTAQPVSAPTVPQQPPTAPNLSTTEAPRPPMSDVGGGPLPSAPAETPPKTSSGGQGAAQSQGATQTPPSPNEQRAKAYASSVGLDWTRLGTGVRKALTGIAQDSEALQRLNPDNVRRQAHLESLRVPIKSATRAQITGDAVDARREAIVSKTREGERIREADAQSNRDIQANLEVLRGRVAGRRGTLAEPVDKAGNPNPASIRGATSPPSRVGQASQKVVRDKSKWSKKGYDALFERARQTDPTAQAPLTPVTDLLTENPDIQHLGWVTKWLNTAAKAKAEREKARLSPEERATAEAKGNAPVQMDSVTLNELHDLRALANKHGGGADGHYAALLKKSVDQAMQHVPEGAKAWKTAIKAYVKHQEEFEDQDVVRALGNNKKGSTSPSVSHEKTWQKVATGPLQQLKELKRTMLTGGTSQLRMQGRKAFRELRAETVNQILEPARNVTAVDAHQRSILTATALRRAINKIPRENLEEILGKKNTRELYDILKARDILGNRATESGTVPNALVLVEKVLGHIPVVGTAAKAGLKGASIAKEFVQSGKMADEATTTPLAEAQKAASKSKPAKQARKKTERARREQIYREIEGSGPTLGSAPAPASEPTLGDIPKKPVQ